MKPVIFLFLFFSACTSLYPYSITREALLLEQDKFLFHAGVQEYFKQGQGSVFILPFVIQLGLAKRVEFIGVFPYIQLRQELTGDIDTFGDILLLLKFRMLSFNYALPFLRAPAHNQIDLVLKFNTATGPSREQAEEFSPYSLGLADFSLGFFYGKAVGPFTLDLNFIYTFAAHIGEEYLPFSDSFWSSSKKSYFFDIHKVFVKFFWPGKYPWADDEAPAWEKDPHIDDYFCLDTGFNYFFNPSWSLFSYDLFIELNWLRSWSKECIYPERLLFTPGFQVHVTDGFIITGSASFLISPNTLFFSFRKGITYRRPEDYYFDRFYFLGVKFLL